MGLLEFLDDGFVLRKWTLSVIPFSKECDFQPVIKGLKRKLLCLVAFLVNMEYVDWGRGEAD